MAAVAQSRTRTACVGGVPQSRGAMTCGVIATVGAALVVDVLAGEHPIHTLALVVLVGAVTGLRRWIAPRFRGLLSLLNATIVAQPALHLAGKWLGRSAEGSGLARPRSGWGDRNPARRHCADRRDGPDLRRCRGPGGRLLASAISPPGPAQPIGATPRRAPAPGAPTRIDAALVRLEVAVSSSGAPGRWGSRLLSALATLGRRPGLSGRTGSAPTAPSTPSEQRPRGNRVTPLRTAATGRHHPSPESNGSRPAPRSRG